MENVRNKLLSFLRVALKGKSAQHSEIIKNCKSLLKFIENSDGIELGQEDKEKVINSVVNEYEQIIGVTQPDPIFLYDGEPGEWFVHEKEKNDFKFFKRYCYYLKDDMKFSDSSIDSIQLSTEKILSFCADPHGRTELKDHKKRGLVVGDVQSGKTANYIALINMACDVGYNIIVLLAGMTSILRQQTQDRIDGGFIGAKSDTLSSTPIFLGVGFESKNYFGIPLTNRKNDFVKFVKENQNAGAQDYNKPIVLVVKKNKSVLSSVADWLKPGKNNIETQNVLIIDDEADNASINTKKDVDEITAINKGIRNIYNNFPIASYVGYTATPFANIFINPFESSLENQDLFPANFIELLEAPSNYFGFDKAFAKTEGLEYEHIQFIDEDDVYYLPTKHKRDDAFVALSDDLKEAIYHFYLSNVVRSLRGDLTKHRSMLINISRFNDIHYEIRDVVEKFHNSFLDLLEEVNNKISKNPQICEEVEDIYSLYTTDKTFKKAREQFIWKDICSLLLSEVRKINITVINNKVKNNERFNYDDYKDVGARVIVIGGFVLSRGLTIEGLITSYFNRNGGAYDSMLQMSRWFGYRYNYDDICKMYMTEENAASFEAINEAVEDLKAQFRRMSVAHKTPKEFGLMVKERPDTLETALMITARNKMYNAKQIIVTTDFSGYAVDTSKIYKSKEKNQKNYDAINKFYTKLLSEGYVFDSQSKKPLIINIEKEYVKNLLNELVIPLENIKFDQFSLCKYLEEEKTLPKWDVVIATGTKGSVEDKFNFKGFSLDPVQRTYVDNGASENFYRISGSKNRLYEPSIFASGLDKEIIDRIKSEHDLPIAADYLAFPERRPLLVIYPVKLKKEKQILSSFDESKVNNVIFGFAIGFPKVSGGIRVKFRANKIKIKEMESIHVDEDEEYDWEDDND